MRFRFLRTSVIFLTLGIALGLTSGAGRDLAKPHVDRVMSTSQPTEAQLLKWLSTGVIADADARSQAVLHIQDALTGQSIKGSVAYYTINGSTHADLRRSMEALRNRYTHADFDAETEWKIHYKYTPSVESTPGTSTFSADETIVITVPQWQNEKDGDPSLARSWDVFSRNLLFHEEGHYLIDEACLAAIRARVARLPGNAPFADVEALCKQTMREYSAMNAEYDHVTNHGSTQGASF